jgi:hypothetical protein
VIAVLSLSLPLAAVVVVAFTFGWVARGEHNYRRGFRAGVARVVARQRSIERIR